MPETRPKIVIKFMGKFRPGLDGANWPYHFPGCNPVWENCEFVFDRHERNYDWIVVYDDLPSVAGERATMWVEELGCPRANTMLITTEPSTIKIYGNNFLKQFGHILTSQEPWAVGHHPGAIYRQPGLVWYYAFSKPRGLYDAIKNHIPLDKTGEISAVCSTKQQKHTLHRQRYDFVMGLKARIPEMELFGRGIKYIEDKADALDAFKQIMQNLIAIEGALGKAVEFSRIGQNYSAWEQLADIREQFPDDPKLGRELELLAPKVADFTLALDKARKFESNNPKQTGSALTWFLKARSIYPQSRQAEKGIQRLLDDILPES